jgi:hypothetical protein
VALARPAISIPNAPVAGGRAQRADDRALGKRSTEAYLSKLRLAAALILAARYRLASR